MSDDDQPDGKRDSWNRADLVKAGFAAGIGSAALAGALLYASRSRKPKPKSPKPVPHATD